MATIKYIDLDGLTQYDGLLKKYIDDGDAKAFKSAKFDESTRILSLYKTETITGTADFTVNIPETDVSGLLKKITNATTGNVVIANADGTVSDGGIKLTDIVADIELATETITELETKVGDGMMAITEEEINALFN